jgi:uncharacterized protein YcgI (DUF1989 family)
MKGQILRIAQIEGGQCADFNCFNLHDYKEFFHTGRTRHMHGLHPTKGHFLWSAPPRERPMLYILEDTLGTNDVLYPRCSGFLFEYHYDLPVHTNCADIQAEAQREYGLTPDDVHDSFNFFVHTGIDSKGQPFLGRQSSRKTDYVDLVAMMDVLAVPNICGADVMATNGFAFKSLRAIVYEATPEDLAAVPNWPAFRNQRTPDMFRNSTIKVDRPLRRDDSYRAEFTNTPIRVEDVSVDLSPDEVEQLQTLKASGLYGSSEGEALRYVLFSWWIEKFMQGPKHFEDLKA